MRSSRQSFTWASTDQFSTASGLISGVKPGSCYNACMTMSRTSRIRAAVIVRFPVESPACRGMRPTSLEHAPPRDRADRAPHLTLLCNAVPARMADRFEQVANQCRSHASSPGPRTTTEPSSFVSECASCRSSRPRQDGSSRPRVAAADSRLQLIPPGASFTRLELGEAIEHRPAPRGAPPDGPVL